MTDTCDYIISDLEDHKERKHRQYFRQCAASLHTCPKEVHLSLAKYASINSIPLAGGGQGQTVPVRLHAVKVPFI